MLELAVKLVLSVIVAFIAYYVGIAVDLLMPWWVAGLIGLALVFGGWLVIIHSDDW